VPSSAVSCSHLHPRAHTHTHAHTQAAAAELTYWTSRLSLANAATGSGAGSSFSSSLHAPLGSGAGCSATLLRQLQVALDEVRHGFEVVQILRQGRGDTTGDAEKGGGGSVSGDIMAAISQLICGHECDEDGDSKSDVCAGGVGLDEAQEVMVWWLCRAYLWAILLQHRTENPICSFRAEKAGVVASSASPCSATAATSATATAARRRGGAADEVQGMSADQVRGMSADEWAHVLSNTLQVHILNSPLAAQFTVCNNGRACN